MKKHTFIYRLIVVAALLLLADMGIGKLLELAYFNIKKGEQGRLTYTADSCRQDIIVLGSSRASHHYIPAIITDSLRLTCYNTGKDKEGIYFELAVLKMILARHHPALIIVDISPVAFVASESDLDAISVLLPYYRMHPEIKPVLNKRSDWEFVKTYSSLYNYNSMLLQILLNGFLPGRDTSAAAANGYAPTYHSFIESFDTARLSRHIAHTADSSLVNVFKQIIQTAASSDCKMIVVSSPVFSMVDRSSPTLEAARQICVQEQIPFLDYTTATYFSGKQSLFGDAFHLNHDGAILFSQILCADLNRLNIIKAPLVVKAH